MQFIADETAADTDLVKETAFSYFPNFGENFPTVFKWWTFEMEYSDLSDKNKKYKFDH